MKVADTIEPLTGEDRVNAFIVGDSFFERTCCKNTQLSVKVFDHCDMRYKKGFCPMTLSLTDGNAMTPVNSCLLSSAKEQNILENDEQYDGRSLAGQRRKLAKMKSNKVTW